jgi:O-antigen/teichoic acid export membrane protein
MLKYALPIMLVGFAGMINEMLDRALMSKLLPFSKIENNIQLGIYSFNYKFSMLMTLFLQAFRYAAEPLFFANSTNKDNKIIYADTMRIFIISAGFIFMAITLNIPLIQKIFMWYSPDAVIYFEGAKVIPILLVANLFLGIYFNISTWYKITDKTHIGAIISIIGAIITFVLNILWIPTLGYMGSAWATLICYGVMVALGYMAEMKYFPIHYDLKRISLYVFISILSFVFLDRISQIWSFSFFIHTLSAFILIMIYVFVVYLSEKKLRQNTKKE